MEDNNFLEKKKIIFLAKSILGELFSLGLILYLILFILEELKEGAVSYYLNINYILVFVIICGILMILFKADKND
jgi:hypothetical protein